MGLLDKERNENLYSAHSYKENTNNWEDDVSIFRGVALREVLEDGKIAEKINTILDVGCGSGGVLAHLSMQKEFEAKVLEGIDISPVAVDIARRLADEKGAGGRVHFAVRSIEDLAESESRDLICLIHVLEHCPDMLEMLEACAERSNYIYINVPLEINLFYVLRFNLIANQYNKYGHLHFFDEMFFVTWLEKNGFEILSRGYARDYLIDKPGFGYNVIKAARWVFDKVFGPALTAKVLAGVSGCYLVKRRDQTATI